MKEFFQDLKISLYDLFGYLIPGFIFLIAVAIFFCSLYFAKSTLDLVEIAGKSSQYWLFVLLASFILGHVSQGIGNLGVLLIPKDQLLSEAKKKSIFNASNKNASGEDKKFSWNLIKMVKTKASIFFGLKLSGFSAIDLYGFCDEAVI